MSVLQKFPCTQDVHLYLLLILSNFCEVTQKTIDLVSIEVEEINTWIMITRQPESLPLMFEFNE